MGWREVRPGGRTDAVTHGYGIKQRIPPECRIEPIHNRGWLLRYRPSTGKVTRVSSLGYECINSVAIDIRGHLWALSPVGLHRIMAAPDGRLYTSAYLLGEDFPAINVISMSMADGKIYLGGNGKFLELQLPAAHPEKPSRILLPDFPPDATSLEFTKGEASRLRVATDNLSGAIPYI